MPMTFAHIRVVHVLGLNVEFPRGMISVCVVTGRTILDWHPACNLYLVCILFRRASLEAGRRGHVTGDT